MEVIGMRVPETISFCAMDTLEKVISGQEG
jgi:hypothetical protein